MKESDITPEIIKLSKEIAEHWRMEIEKFGWFSLDCDPSPFNLDSYTFWKEGECIHQATHDLLNPNQVTIFTKREWFPIPSISDCLEKLRRLDIEGFGKLYECKETTLHPLWDYVKGGCSIQRLHQALLSALLKVLK